MIQTFRLLCAFAFICVCHYINAQTTENFDSRPANAKSFTSGGLTFNLTAAGNNFSIMNRATLGYNGSNQFMEFTDNPSNSTYGGTGIIAATGGTFKVNNFWFYVTGNAAQSPGGINPGWAAGTVTFTGKRAGNEVFSFIKGSGFDINPATALPSKGFVYINFATEGASNYTSIAIDQLEIKMNPSYEYFAIDNFNWTLDALPVTFGKVAASVTQNNLEVSWQTLSETNNDHFTIEVSADGVNFTEIGHLSSKSTRGNSDTAIDYEFTFNLNEKGLAGALILGLFMFLPFRRRFRNIGIASIMMALGSISCQKSADIDIEGKNLYVRIAQIDKDGTKSYSRIVKAAAKY